MSTSFLKYHWQQKYEGEYRRKLYDDWTQTSIVQIDFESVTKTAPLMAIIEPNESPIDIKNVVHDLRAEMKQEMWHSKENLIS